MKINFLVPHLKIAGGIMVLVEYAHYLSLFGHEVKVIVVNTTKFQRLCFNFFYYKPKWLRAKKFKIKAIAKLVENVLPKADVLIFSSSEHALAVEDYSQKVGKKVYIVQHDERLYHGQRELVAKTYALPYVFITVATWLSDMLMKEFDQKPYLLLNVLDQEIFHLYDIKKNLDSIRILMLQHTYQWKGVKEGVEIVSELKNKYPNIKLIMYGARQDRAECDEYHFQPIGKEVAKIHASCDIFLCPSWDEGFGLPSLEAMACGCVLVTYDNGGSRDYAFDHLTALVAKRKDVQDLKNKLELAIIDKKLRQDIINNAQSFVKNMPSWLEQAKKLEYILEKKITNR